MYKNINKHVNNLKISKQDGISKKTMNYRMYSSDRHSNSATHPSIENQELNQWQKQNKKNYKQLLWSKNILLTDLSQFEINEYWNEFKSSNNKYS